MYQEVETGARERVEGPASFTMVVQMIKSDNPFEVALLHPRNQKDKSIAVASYCSWINDQLVTVHLMST